MEHVLLFLVGSLVGFVVARLTTKSKKTELGPIDSGTGAGDSDAGKEDPPMST